MAFYLDHKAEIDKYLEDTRREFKGPAGRAPLAGEPRPEPGVQSRISRNRASRSFGLHFNGLGVLTAKIRITKCAPFGTYFPERPFRLPHNHLQARAIVALVHLSFPCPNLFRNAAGGWRYCRRSHPLY
jgi:hypothetical protein